MNSITFTAFHLLYFIVYINVIMLCVCTCVVICVGSSVLYLTEHMIFLYRKELLHTEHDHDQQPVITEFVENSNNFHLIFVVIIVHCILSFKIYYKETNKMGTKIILAVQTREGQNVMQFYLKKQQPISHMLLLFSKRRS